MYIFRDCQPHPILVGLDSALNMDLCDIYIYTVTITYILKTICKICLKYVHIDLKKQTNHACSSPNVGKYTKTIEIIAPWPLELLIKIPY